MKDEQSETVGEREVLRVVEIVVSKNELKIFINTIKILHINNKDQYFTNIHLNYFKKIHDTPIFLPWYIEFINNRLPKKAINLETPYYRRYKENFKFEELRRFGEWCII